jgi:glutathione S-transferase
LLRFFPSYYRFRHKISQTNLEKDRAVVAATLDRIDQERQGRTYLLGEDFTIADLTAAALLAALLQTTRNPVPAASGAAAASAGVPRRRAAPSDGAVGGRYLYPPSRTVS